MKNIFQKFGTSIAVIGTAIAMPFSAMATFTDGMVIPDGTTDNVTGAISTYFFPTVLATLFQDQVIQIVVALAALGVTWFAVRMVIGKIMHPHR